MPLPSILDTTPSRSNSPRGVLVAEDENAGPEDLRACDLVFEPPCVLRTMMISYSYWIG